MNNMYYCVICTMDHCDEFYLKLKKREVHFAIFQTDNTRMIASHYQNKMEVYQICQKADINQILFSIDNYQDTSDHSLDLVDENKINYVFIVKKLRYLSQKLYIAAEQKIHRLIPEGYHYHFSYHCHDNEFRKFPIYKKEIMEPNNKKVLIIEKSNGYGDSIITMPLLRQYALQLQSEGYDVEFWHYYEKSLLLSDVFLHEFKNSLCKYMDDRASLSQLDLEEGSYHTIKNMDSFIITSAYSKLQETANFLGYTSADSIELNKNELYYPYVDDCIDENIKKLRKKFTYLIGVQFDTFNNQVCPYVRFWNSSNVTEYISLCHQNSIGVVNMADYSDKKIAFDMDVSSLTIPQLFSVVNKLDLITGIDSSCGHIAGVLGIPNLTIWGKILANKSQKTLRMNYSLIHETGNADNIKPSIVLEKTLLLLQNKLHLKTDIGGIYNIEQNPTTQIISDCTFDKDIQELFCEMNHLFLDMDSDLSESGVNSMNFVQFIVALEDKYEIDIDDRHLNIKNFKNLNELAQIIKEYVSAKEENDTK